MSNARANAADGRNADDWFPHVYDELRGLAKRFMAQEKPGQTLTATELVHQTYLRLWGNAKGFENSGHFFAAAARAMKWYLINRARDKNRLKRGGGLQRLDLDAIELPTDTPPEELLALNEALEELAVYDSVAEQVVNLRFYCGLTIAETAAALGMKEPAVSRTWTHARAWLRARLQIAEDSTVE